MGQPPVPPTAVPLPRAVRRGRHRPCRVANGPILKFRGRRALALIGALVAAPVVGIIASLFGRHWFATGDQALELLRIRDVGTSHTPLVGAWSRWGWAHPGPLLFWLLAPFERVFGETGVLTGTAVLNLTCMLGVVVLGHRRGGIRLAALTALMVTLLAHGAGSTFVDPWNPYAALFPFLAVLLLVWSVLCGDLLMLPIAVVVGSFAVQAHAGYLPLVGGLLVLAVVWCVVPLWRQRATDGLRRAPATRWLALATGLGLLVWLPAIIDQLTGGNNLRKLLAYSFHSDEPTAGWDLAFNAMGRELRPNGAWITGHDTGGLGFMLASPAWPGILMLVAVAAAGAYAWHRKHRDAARLAVVSIVAVVLAVGATSRVTGIFVPYVMHWWWAVSAIATLSIVWCVVVDIRDARRRHLVAFVALVGVIATGTIILRDLPPVLPGGDLSEAIATVGPPTAAALEHGKRYLVRGIDPSTLSATPNGLHLELERRGFDVVTDRDEFSSLRFGSWRVAAPSDVDGLVMIVDIPDVDAGTWTVPPGGRLVATYDPLTSAQRARFRELDAQVRAILGSSAPEQRISFGLDEFRSMQRAGVPDSLLAEMLALVKYGDGYEVFVAPPPAA